MGLAVFLAGVGLLALTFKLAYEEFSVPHSQNLGLVKGQALDAVATGGKAFDILVRLGVLLLMAVVSSLVANKGIGLYCGSLHPVDKHAGPSPATPKKSDVAVEDAATSPGG